jgi:peroxiredoxin Q/BCP
MPGSSRHRRFGNGIIKTNNVVPVGSVTSVRRRIMPGSVGTSLRIGILSVLMLAVVTRAEELNVGDVAPDFQCCDERGQMWNSKDHVGKHLIVVYFYKSDFASCCTGQAKRYRDDLPKLANHCAEVIGISCDSPACHELFATQQDLNFSLLSDPRGEVAQKFGVPVKAGGKAMARNADGQTIFQNGKPVTFTREFTADRATFVIGFDGKVVYSDVEINPKGDSRQVLEFLK